MKDKKEFYDLIDDLEKTLINKFEKGELNNLLVKLDRRSNYFVKIAEKIINKGFQRI